MKDCMLRKMMAFAYLVTMIGLFFVFFQTVHATGGKISGQVFEVKTKRSLADVRVRLFKKYKPTSKTTKTNLEGKFKIFEVPPGVYDVEFALEGYANLLVKEIVVKANQISTIKDLSMRKEMKEGDTITVPIRNDTSEVRK